MSREAEALPGASSADRSNRQGSPKPRFASDQSESRANSENIGSGRA